MDVERILIKVVRNTRTTVRVDVEVNEGTGPVDEVKADVDIELFERRRRAITTWALLNKQNFVDFLKELTANLTSRSDPVLISCFDEEVQQIVGYSDSTVEFGTQTVMSVKVGE